MSKIEHIVGEDQSIFDLAIQMSGSLDGLSDIIGLYDDIRENKQGETIIIDKKEDPILDEIIANEYKIATNLPVSINYLVNASGNNIVNASGNKIITRTI